MGTFSKHLEHEDQSVTHLNPVRAVNGSFAQAHARARGHEESPRSLPHSTCTLVAALGRAAIEKSLVGEMSCVQVRGEPQQPAKPEVFSSLLRRLSELGSWPTTPFKTRLVFVTNSRFDSKCHAKCQQVDVLV
jgi:hypothetical protein